MVAVDVTKTLPNDALTQTSAMPTNLPEGWNYEAVFGTLLAQTPRWEGTLGKTRLGPIAKALREAQAA